MGIEKIEVNTAKLIEDSNMLTNTGSQVLLSNPPSASESGVTIEKLTLMAKKMYDIHKATYDLINSVSRMLNQMGYKFKETDKEFAEMINNYNGICPNEVGE